MSVIEAVKHAYGGQTDGQKDGRNYDPQYRASIKTAKEVNFVTPKSSCYAIQTFFFILLNKGDHMALKKPRKN